MLLTKQLMKCVEFLGQDQNTKRNRKQIEKHIVINCELRDWNRIDTNFAMWLAFLLQVVNLVANIISWTNCWQQRPAVMRVMLRIGTHGTCPSLCLTSPHPPHQTCQLGIRFGWIPASSCRLKYSNSATELLGDSVAQFVRAWQAICQVVSSSLALSHSWEWDQLAVYRIMFICST